MQLAFLLSERMRSVSDRFFLLEGLSVTDHACAEFVSDKFSRTVSVRDNFEQLSLGSCVFLFLPQYFDPSIWYLVGHLGV